MSYELEDLDPRQPLGTFTNSNPLVAYFNLSTAEARNFVVAITVSGVTGAGPTYASPVLQTTWDDGDTWETVANVELQDITATGSFLVYATSIMGPVSPVCRITWTPVAAHTITVSDLRKARHAPGDAMGGTPPSTTGGAGSTTIASPLGAQAEATSVAVALATDQATQTAPLGVRETNGTNWLESVALAAAQLTKATATAMKFVGSVILGWDGTTHREIALGSDGAIKRKEGGEYSERVYHSYSSVNVTTGAWVELIAATANESVEIEIFDSSGVILELGIGAAASEVSKHYVMPGGNGRIPFDIPAGSRLAIKAVNANATAGYFVANIYKH